MMNILNKLNIGIVCSALLACLSADAAEGEMQREPAPGERIEKTKLGDEEIERLLVGKWTHENKIPDVLATRQTYTFGKEGGYVVHRVDHIRFPNEKREFNEKGEWKVRDGILTLTPTDPKGKEHSLHGRFTAYTIMKISESVIEWQIDWENSDASPAVKRTLTISTHKRAK
jgi:hypothetical protein